MNESENPWTDEAFNVPPFEQVNIEDLIEMEGLTYA
jgi:hypothetical protein